MSIMVRVVCDKLLLWTDILAEWFSGSGSLPGFSTKGGRILVRPLVFRETSRFLTTFIRADECKFLLDGQHWCVHVVESIERFPL